MATTCDDDDNNDFNEEEGRIARKLFRTGSDSDESDNNDNDKDHSPHDPDHGNDYNDNHHDDKDGNDSVTLGVDVGSSSRIRRQRRIGNIVLEETQLGGSIAEKLWPAAKHLADYILSLAGQPVPDATGDDDDDAFPANIAQGKHHYHCAIHQEENNHVDDDNDDDNDGRGNQNNGTRFLSGGGGSSSRSGSRGQRRLLRRRWKGELSSSSSMTLVLQIKSELIQILKNHCRLAILELGAGVGLTGLQLATHLPARVLLTDIQQGLVLLERNRQLNQDQFMLNHHHHSTMKRLENNNDNENLDDHDYDDSLPTVQVQELDWGVSSHHAQALDWYYHHRDTSSSSTRGNNNNNHRMDQDPTSTGDDHHHAADDDDNNNNNNEPLIVVGSDLVYWEELHEPLEHCLFHILKEAPKGTWALLAGMRRWKRDSHFFQTLGQRTRTRTHQLQCTCLEEFVWRRHSIVGPNDKNKDDDKNDNKNNRNKNNKNNTSTTIAMEETAPPTRREICRIYAISILQEK